jgi:hypothetical protein
LFVIDNPNLKGNIAEAALAFAAVKSHIPVFKPVGEHGRADLVLEIGDRLHRVQCKWGRLSKDRRAIVVNLAGSRLTPAGYIRTSYAAGEVDLVGVYC